MRDDQRRLEDRAVALGIADHVVFAGYVDESEKADVLRLADVSAIVIGAMSVVAPDQRAQLPPELDVRLSDFGGRGAAAGGPRPVSRAAPPRRTAGAGGPTRRCRLPREPAPVRGTEHLGHPEGAQFGQRTSTVEVTVLPSRWLPSTARTKAG